MRFLATLLTLAAALCAQTVTLPAPAPLFSNLQLPVASGIGRYQQWFSAAQATANFGSSPIRIQSLTILAGSSATITTTLDCEVSMCIASPLGLASTFDQNYVGTRTVVRPRTNLTLTTATAGNPVLTIPFTELFTWDGASPFLVEFRIFGNGRSNAPFNADQRGTDLGFGAIQRVYQSGNASATSGSIASGSGLFMRFQLRTGGKVHYGNGCRGINFITPTGDTVALGQPGQPWTHRLENAAAQTFAILALGPSRTVWNDPNGAIPLPLDLANVLGAPGCFLVASPEITVFAPTIGGPGTATANVVLQVPPLPEFVGISMFSQWFVFDGAAVNGVLAGTDGLWSVFAPVGG